MRVSPFAGSGIPGHAGPCPPRFLGIIGSVRAVLQCAVTRSRKPVVLLNVSTPLHMNFLEHFEFLINSPERHHHCHQVATSSIHRPDASWRPSMIDCYILYFISIRYITFVPYRTVYRTRIMSRLLSFYSSWQSGYLGYSITFTMHQIHHHQFGRASAFRAISKVHPVCSLLSSSILFSSSLQVSIFVFLGIYTCTVRDQLCRFSR